MTIEKDVWNANLTEWLTCNLIDVFPTWKNCETNLPIALLSRQAI